MTAAAPDPELKLLSSISGRQRWFVPALKDRPRLAAAVEEAIVREAPGVAVRANPITGRVLLEWRQPEAPGSTRELVVRAALVKPCRGQMRRRQSVLADKWDELIYSN